MPRPADVTHVVLEGNLGPQEVFNTGFWLTGNTPVDDAGAQALANLIVALPSFASFITFQKPMLAPDSAYTTLKVYAYPSAGLGAQGVGVAAIAGGIGTAANGNALQVCRVATLKSGVASRSGRGRMYLPADGLADISTHLFIALQTTNTANTLALLFTAINAMLPGRVVSVVSATHGVTHPVVNVTVDNKPDIQRRHANKQTPTFTQVAVL